LVLSELKETLKSDNTQHIKERLEGVKTALMEMGVSNYSQQVETSDYSQDAHESDDVIDAEIIESPK
jgi:molecular chaperone DnaK